MIYVLILSVAVPMILSAFCSLMEAALYAVPLALAKHLAEGGSRRGRALLTLKTNIERPISAILILNTIATTAGASVAGWAYGEVFGERFGKTGLLVFSTLFIVVILFCSEIIPKILGVIYCRSVGPSMALPLHFLVRLLSYPIKLSEWISGTLKPEEKLPRVSEEEMLSMAALGTEEGALDRFEGSVIANVIELDKLLVRDVLTPRVVVFRVPEGTELADLEQEITTWTHSRVPLYAESDPDHLTSYVMQRDVYRELLRGNKQLRLADLARPLEAVPELMRVDRCLLRMFEQKEQICSVVDEHGGLAGIIALEDIIEELLGREIVDEYDTVSDLRTFAQILKVTRAGRRVGGRKADPDKE